MATRRPEDRVSTWWGREEPVLRRRAFAQASLGLLEDRAAFGAQPHVVDRLEERVRRPQILLSIQFPGQPTDPDLQDPLRSCLARMSAAGIR
jgi:hypothetical protein